MNIQALLLALQLQEDKDWEFKSAKGGLPSSLWETYSAMANTDGGVIVLGVKELEGGQFEIQGLDDCARMERDFWNTINNRGKVSANLLANADVRSERIDDKTVLVIVVPRATRRQRPVFVGQNPLTGTYRRYNDGDYLCTADEVGRMLADQSDEPADGRILPPFNLDDLDAESLRQYRHRFASRSPAHPWLALDDRGLFEKLGGWRSDRTTGEEGLTVAALLLFGKDEVIRDPAAVPQYHVDYRERLSDDPQVRWSDRVWPDGTWVANLFQFFERVFPRLVRELKIPFQLLDTQQPSLLQRHDETIVHEAIREAFVNALIHADFRGQGGIIVERHRDRLEFSNPGTLLLSIEQVLKGGVSECRNKVLQTMFAMLGYGERAGSGIDKIRQGWASQKWRWPLIEEQLQPDRVRLTLPMVSLLPEESLIRLRTVLGEDLGGLDPREVQALVTADVEGSVTNQRLQQFMAEHTVDITRVLQELVGKGLLVKDGYGRWASYRLSERLVDAGSNAGGTPGITARNSGHTASGSPHKPGSSPHNEPSSPQGDPVLSDSSLLAIAAPSRTKERLLPEQTEQIILELCRGRFLTYRQIGELLRRDAKRTKDRFLSKMVKDGRLKTKYADPTHPEQAYQTNPDWREP